MIIQCRRAGTLLESSKILSPANPHGSVFIILCTKAWKTTAKRITVFFCQLVLCSVLGGGVAQPGFCETLSLISAVRAEMEEQRNVWEDELGN